MKCTKMVSSNTCDFVLKVYKIVHYDASAMKRLYRLHNSPSARTANSHLSRKRFFARVSYEILYHEV